jgi:hypothetical protein
MSRLRFGEAGVSGLLQILEVSRSRNVQLGISGVLYSEGLRFTQVLEGPPEAVETVFRSIANDERHYDVAVVARANCLRREFANWSMALVDEAECQTALRRIHNNASMSHDRVAAFVATMKALLSLGVNE